MESETIAESSASEKRADVSENVNTDQPAYDAKNVHYEGDVAIYRDPHSGYEYTWNKAEERWDARVGVAYGFEDDTHTYTDADGVKYFWDKEKSAWFPKIDDDFMAIYQMNYGFTEAKKVVEEKEASTSTKNEIPATEGGPPPATPTETTPTDPGNTLKRKPPAEPTWFDIDDAHNTNVYVSNLPTDITEPEFVEFMQKGGVIMRDPATQQLKVKLYKEPGTDHLKGDALCTYLRIESIDLALNLLDGSLLKDKKVRIERAKFEMKGTFDPKLKPKRRRKKDKEKVKRMQDKLFDWRPERMRGERAKHERIVIVRNVFEPSIFDDEVGLILEYQEDLREEAAKCGEVRKVTIFDRHPEGIVQINMRAPEEADEVVRLLHNRWFGKRQLSAAIFDGKTKFRIAETESEITQRIEKWDEFLADKGKAGEASGGEGT